MSSLSLWERSHKRYGDRRELSETGEGVVTQRSRNLSILPINSVYQWLSDAHSDSDSVYQWLSDAHSDSGLGAQWFDPNSSDWPLTQGLETLGEKLAFLYLLVQSTSTGELWIQ